MSARDPRDHASNAAAHFEAMLASPVGTGSLSGTRQIVLLAQPGDIPDWLDQDRIGSLYMVALVRMDGTGNPEMARQHQRRVADAALKAAHVFCGRVTFNCWAAREFGLDPDTMAWRDLKAAGAALIYRECKITSRAQLRTDPIARVRFHGILNRFHGAQGMDGWKPETLLDLLEDPA